MARLMRRAPLWLHARNSERQSLRVSVMSRCQTTGMLELHEPRSLLQGRCKIGGMPASTPPEQIVNRRTALLAWEATCERLGNAFSHNPAVPELSPDELRQAIGRAHALLNVLERLYCAKP
jgi:hypothetical protein